MSLAPLFAVPLALALTAASIWSAYALREDMVKKPLINLLLTITTFGALFAFFWYDETTELPMWIPFLVVLGLSVGPYVADASRIYIQPEQRTTIKLGVVASVASMVIGPTVISLTGWTIPNAASLASSMILGYLILLVTRYFIPLFRRNLGNRYTLIGVALFFLVYVAVDFSGELSALEIHNTFGSVATLATNIFIDAGLCALGFIAWGRKLPERKPTTPTTPPTEG